jgi:hypothetical protein
LANVLQAIGNATSSQKTVEPVDSPAPADTKIAAKADTAPKADADHERKFTRFTRHARARSDVPRTDSTQPRLRALPDADGSGKPERDAAPAAKQTTKSAGAQHNRRSERKSAHAS